MMNLTQEMGRYFGYPACCIVAYEEIQAKSGRKTPEQAYLAAIDRSGFIPCPEHAKQIIEGKTTIQSLIQNRICPLPFPKEPEMKVLDEYLAESA